MRNLPAIAWAGRHSRSDQQLEFSRDLAIVPARRLGKDIVVSNGRSPLLETAAPASSQQEDLPTVSSAFGSDVYPFPNRKNKDAMADSEYGESAVFGEIFLEWKSSKSVSHLNCLLSAVAYYALDDLFCEQFHAMIPESTVPAVDNNAIFGYAMTGRRTGVLRSSSGSNNREKDATERRGRMMTTAKKEIGAFVDEDGNPNMHWPVLAAKNLEYLVGNSIGGTSLQDALPRLYKMHQGTDYRSLGLGGYLAFANFVNYVIKSFVFPTGKFYKPLDVTKMTRGERDKLSATYKEIVANDRNRRDRRMSDTYDMFGVMLGMARKMTLSLSAPVQSTKTLGIYRPNGTWDEVPFSDLNDDVESFRAFFENTEMPKMSVHTEVKVPKLMAQHMCQSEDCDIGKVFKAASRLAGIAFPENATMTDAKFDEDRPALSVLDAEELDATAEMQMTSGGYDISPIAPSELANEDGVSMSLNGAVVWLPKEKDGAYSKYGVEFREQNTTDIGGRRVLSPFLNKFLNDTALSSADMKDEEKREEADAEQDWVNRKLGGTSYVKARDRTNRANKILKRSGAFGKLVYTNNDGEQITWDVEGNRPARAQTYLLALRRQNAASRIVPSGDATKGITNRRTFIGVLKDMHQFLSLAGLDESPFSHVKQDDLWGTDETRRELAGIYRQDQLVEPYGRNWGWQPFHRVCLDTDGNGKRRGKGAGVVGRR